MRERISPQSRRTQDDQVAILKSFARECEKLAEPVRNT
jgi:hypothetical protein